MVFGCFLNLGNGGLGAARISMYGRNKQSTVQQQQSRPLTQQKEYMRPHLVSLVMKGVYLESQLTCLVAFTDSTLFRYAVSCGLLDPLSDTMLQHPNSSQSKEQTGHDILQNTLANCKVEKICEHFPAQIPRVSDEQRFG